LRRALGLILLALGVFAVAGAALLPTYVYPKLAKVPLDQDSTSVLEGTASKVLAVTDKGAVYLAHSALGGSSDLVVVEPAR